MKQEISGRYSKEQLKILESKIESLKNTQHKILEFPKLKANEIEDIKKAKLELEQKKKSKIEFDWIECERIVYIKPANFGWDRMAKNYWN